MAEEAHQSEERPGDETPMTREISEENVLNDEDELETTMPRRIVHVLPSDDSTRAADGQTEHAPEDDPDAVEIAPGEVTPVYMDEGEDAGASYGTAEAHSEAAPATEGHDDLGGVDDLPPAIPTTPFSTFDEQQADVELDDGRDIEAESPAASESRASDEPLSVPPGEMSFDAAPSPTTDRDEETGDGFSDSLMSVSLTEASADSEQFDSERGAVGEVANTHIAADQGVREDAAYEPPVPSVPPWRPDVPQQGTLGRLTKSMPPIPLRHVGGAAEHAGSLAEAMQPLPLSRMPSAPPAVAEREPQQPEEPPPADPGSIGKPVTAPRATVSREREDVIERSAQPAVAPTESRPRVADISGVHAQVPQDYWLDDDPLERMRLNLGLRGTRPVTFEAGRPLPKPSRFKRAPRWMSILVLLVVLMGMAACVAGAVSFSASFLHHPPVTTPAPSGTLSPAPTSPTAAP